MLDYKFGLVTYAGPSYSQQVDMVNGSTRKLNKCSTGLGNCVERLWVCNGVGLWVMLATFLGSASTRRVPAGDGSTWAARLWQAAGIELP